jgi:hypothetical protein
MSCASGKNHQYNECKDNEKTPLLVARILTFEPLTCNSTTSSLTIATVHYKEEEGSAKKQNLPAEPPLFNNSPSPVKKKMLSNFDVHQSDKDSILSGDESDRWEYEEDRVAHFFAKQSKMEDQVDYAAMACPPVTKVEG